MANLCVEGNLDLESGINVYSVIGQQHFIFFYRSAGIQWEQQHFF